MAPTCEAKAPSCGCDNNCGNGCGRCHKQRCCKERCCRQPRERCCKERCCRQPRCHHHNRCNNSCGCEMAAPSCGCGK
jgi:hypothetical protein